MQDSSNYNMVTQFQPMDDEHNQVVSLINSLQGAINHGPKEAIAVAMDAMVKKCLEHFAFEERLMEQHPYPQMDEHKEAHAIFRSDLRRFHELLAARGPTEPFQRWATMRLGSWFRTHISRHDIGLASVLRGSTEEV